MSTLSKPWVMYAKERPGLLTDLALSIAAARVTLVTSCLGLSLREPAPEGLAPLWEATQRVEGVDPALLQAITEAAAPLTPHELGIFYESSLHPSTATKEGLFYTPQWLASELTRKALQSRTGNILDPACGGGAFLLAAFELCATATSPRHAIVSLYGVDRDELAASVCRAALLCSIGRWGSISELHDDARILAHQIRHGDSLLDPEAISTTERSWIDNRLLIPWEKFAPQGGFDAVIGNPPYGLSRGEKIAAPEKALLRRLYRNWISGKINKYLLFMARGYELLCSGGQLGFVVPNSWLAISNATALRRRLVHDGGLVEICDFSELLFETAGVEVVTVVAQKKGRRTHITIKHKSSATSAPQQAFEFPTPACSSDCQIPLRWSTRSEALLAQIEGQSIPLGSAASPVIPRIALQAYSTGKGSPPQSPAVVKARPFDRTSPEGPNVYPYYQGSDIERYQLNWSGGYLHYGPFLAEPQELSRFFGPRIVIREILGAAPHLLRAAFIDDTALYNKSVLHITAKPTTSRETVLALLGILNSKLASGIIQLRGRKSQRRLFPKLLNADLKEFPIPPSLERDGLPLAQLVQQRLFAPHAEQAALETKIETAVLKLYGLPSNAPAALNVAGDSGILESLLLSW